MTVKRATRVAEEVREVLATLITQQVSDPKVGFVTVTDVAMTDDLRQAKVYVSIYGSDEKVTETLHALARVSAFLRRELGHRTRLRYTPELRFYRDEAALRGARIDQLLRGGEANELPPAPVETGREALSIGEKVSGPLPDPVPRQRRRVRRKR